MSCVQLSEGRFQLVCHLGLWSRSSGVAQHHIPPAQQSSTLPSHNQSCPPVAGARGVIAYATLVSVTTR